ncbi:DUF4368 domain-containing protein [Bacillus atrophaeus]|uniref:DUF4368 domain-containing protein n=1 Tax=Bacillus atrophaeus TaxID=1452 RepID=UPI0022810F60|nr:DUF4368 domain-containing protein [Bacillus atrophaeus]MCY9136274.1 DUF4368 domain-containing protein [Bacillus atrophaeus]
MLVGTGKVSPIRNRIGKKAIDKKKAAIKISAILEQLKTVLNLNTLTIEMLLRFIERIEVTESNDVKIYYKFA